MKHLILEELDEDFILTTGDDFHNNNLKSGDRAYHRGSKKIVKVITKKPDVGSWTCEDGIDRDSYKLFKVLVATEKKSNSLTLKVEFVQKYKTTNWIL